MADNSADNPVNESDTEMALPLPQTGEDQSYRVLARKYRPATFEDLVGQDAMVRILRAAFETGRVAHAYMLTGVRGVGKTTTARLLARALNYTDAAGNSTPTIAFTTPGKNCQDILEGRHMDVLEMDAASRTSIDDIREIIESAKFKPAIGAYKVFIIDEVHMLSKAAFNGLLKILEEPPPHVKFIFATTEIRKVPVTILSRCQRFDLKRIEPVAMIAHLQSVCDAEGVAVDDKALALLARAAEGSVRDALSLLDQAIAQGLAVKGDTENAAPIDDALVRDMLGLADRERVLDLLDLLFRGEAAAALDELKAQYDLGADPLEVVRDLLELVNWLTRLQVAGDAVQDGSISETQMTRGRAMVQKLGVDALSRAWQILLKGLSEAQSAPRPVAAVEMVLVRFCYASTLPSPDELVRRLQGRAPTDGRGGTASQPSSGGAAMGSTLGSAVPAVAGRTYERGGGGASAPLGQAAHAPQMAAAPEPMAANDQPAPALSGDLPDVPAPTSFADVVDLIRGKRDLRLLADVEAGVHVVRFDPNRIEFRPSAEAPDNLPGRLSQALEKWTGKRWVVSVSNETGAPTVREQKQAAERVLEDQLRTTDLVKAAFEAFPDAQVARVGPSLPLGDDTTDDD